MVANWLSSFLSLRSSSHSQDIRPIVERFLSGFGIGYSMIPFDEKLYAASREEGLRRNIPMDSLVPNLKAAAFITSVAYGHLPDESLKVSIALYTALVIYVDDDYAANIDGIRNFPKQFLAGKPQANSTLDGLAQSILEFQDFYDPLPANIITTSTLNFISSTIMEHDLQSVTTPSRATKFVYFSRLLSAIADGYAVFMFPREIPFQNYAHAFPELMFMVASMNDILSFYKEELVGETVNYVSAMANCRQMNKLDALRVLVDETHAARNLAFEFISDEAARKAVEHWIQGYTNYHFSSARYKLHELFAERRTTEVSETS